VATIEELVDQLRTAKGLLVSERERLIGEIGRIDIAINALSGADGGQVVAVPLETAKPEREVRTAAPKKAPVKKAVKAPGRVATVDYSAVATWMNDTKAAGTYNQKAGAAHFGVPLSTFKNWSAKCGQMGLLNAAPVAPVEAAPTPKATSAKVLACSECDATFEITQVGRLNGHTLSAHGRRPLLEERQPVAA